MDRQSRTVLIMVKRVPLESQHCNTTQVAIFQLVNRTYPVASLVVTGEAKGECSNHNADKEDLTNVEKIEETNSFKNKRLGTA